MNHKKELLRGLWVDQKTPPTQMIRPEPPMPCFGLKLSFCAGCAWFGFMSSYSPTIHINIPVPIPKDSFCQDYARHLQAYGIGASWFRGFGT